MTGPPPALAAVRSAVRAGLADLVEGSAAGDPVPMVLVACSGGADSTALADAAAFLAAEGTLRVGLVTVDHGLQADSSAQAGRVRAWASGRGLAPVEVVRTDPGDVSEGESGGGGPEARARAARYAALDRVAERHAAAAVLLGHTLDDQAETVLLGLARGSGSRSLAGMAGIRGRYRRPLLGLRRTVTVQACAAADLPVWADPQNADPAFTRVRIRALLDAAEDAAPGIVAGLGRSARLLRDDADALEVLAAEADGSVRAADGELDCAALAALPRAIRSRVLRSAVLRAGARPGSFGMGHVEALDALITDWHGQHGPSLPGPVRAERVSGRLRITGTTGSGDEPWIGSPAWSIQRKSM